MLALQGGFVENVVDNRHRALIVEHVRGNRFGGGFKIRKRIAVALFQINFSRRSVRHNFVGNVFAHKLLVGEPTERHLNFEFFGGVRARKVLFRGYRDEQVCVGRSGTCRNRNIKQLGIGNGVCGLIHGNRDRIRPARVNGDILGNARVVSGNRACLVEKPAVKKPIVPRGGFKRVFARDIVSEGRLYLFGRLAVLQVERDDGLGGVSFAPRKRKGEGRREKSDGTKRCKFFHILPPDNNAFKTRFFQ